MVGDYLTRHSFLLSITCLSLILVFSLLLLNRSFAVGAMVGILFLLFTYQKISISKKAIVLSILVLSAIILFLAICVESDSSLGRLLIYKVSAKMFLEHPFTGIGWGEFQREYNLYQAAFFKSGNYTQKEFLLADNTFYAFNDYWEFIVETGVVGGLGLITFISLTIFLIYNRLRTDDNRPFLKLLIAILLTISVAAFYTHVFERKLLQTLVLTSLTYIILYNNIDKLKPQLRAYAFLLISVVASLTVYYTEIKNIHNYQKLEQAKLLSETGYITESIKLFTGLYPILKDDVGFLKSYSEMLLSENMRGKKISVLQQILNQYTDNATFLKLGLTFDELGIKEQAETALLQSVYMVPNRFAPKGSLYDFYMKNKQYEKAAYWRRIILTMPVKIPSERILAIKKTVKTTIY
jgi:hypothetical protein